MNALRYRKTLRVSHFQILSSQLGHELGVHMYTEPSGGSGIFDE